MKTQDFEIAFDVGHKSIGWAVIQSTRVLGCGAVTFAPDDCLASKRRDFRRQRRHIRSTKQRIARIKLLLTHLGVLTKEQLDRPGCAWPWLLSARVLADKSGSNPALLLSWPELWDVLRWYAHNRGYDGNRRWSAADAAALAEDTEKEKKALDLMHNHGAETMAATFCAELKIDPLGKKNSSMTRFKGLNAAFPREIVEKEVREILQTHAGKLAGVDAQLEKALLEDWAAVPCPALKLPRRYQGGLLFGQLVPRFENRIIATCPIMFERVYQKVLEETCDPSKAANEAEKKSKVPSRECVEFYRFRWAMQLANVQVSTGRGRETRKLKPEECKVIDAKMQLRGFLTPTEFKKAVREVTGNATDNLDQTLMLPDAHEALLLDPVKKLITTHAPTSIVWPLLPTYIQKRTVGLWRRGRQQTLGEIIGHAKADEHQKIMAALDRYIDAENTKKGKKDKSLSCDTILSQPLMPPRLGQRAAYHRNILGEAYDDVMLRGIHPKEKDGCLYRDESIRQTQMARVIDQQTNNHLVRHRIRILERLHKDILKEYVGDEKARVRRVTIEVNRQLRELSGKTRKEQEQELGFRLSNFKSVVKKLESELAGKDRSITAGLIRKARIAEDLGWTCPYTGKPYDVFDLLHRKVDKDHIIPRSDRASDSLDSLVITFCEVNRMKGKRTARQFVEEFQGKTVEGSPNLAIRNLKDYLSWVERLDTKGHSDDQNRKRRRKELLKLREYVAKEFVPRDLTQTSQLVRLGAQALERAYDHENRPPIISLPGSITAVTRRNWNLLGCLISANKDILDEEGNPRSKTEIRTITDLHHALDACVLALAGHLLPSNGGIWQLLIKRKLLPQEQILLKSALKDLCTICSDGSFRLESLPDAIKEDVRLRLAERRVVQHISSDMTGLSADQTVWRIFDPEDAHPSAHRLKTWLKLKVENGEIKKIPSRDDETALIVCRKRRSTPGGDSGKTLHETKTWRWIYQELPKSKLIGHAPNRGDGSLQKIKAVKILAENYGLALDPTPSIIRFYKVFPTLRKLKEDNGGKWPRVIRKGQLIHIKSGSRAGIWRVLSVKETEAYGLALDLAYPDSNASKPARPNAPIEQLLKDEFVIIDCPFTGVDSSKVAYAEAKKRPRKSKPKIEGECPSTSSA